MKFYSLLILVCIAFSCQGQEGAKEYLLKPQSFKTEFITHKGQLLDVRTADEFDQGHISGALNIDFLQDDFSANLSKLDKDQPVYVYCKSGTRSAKAIEKLREQGFTKLFELDGGYNAWKVNQASSKL